MHFQGERKKFHTSPPLFSCPRAPRSTAAQSRPRPRAPPRSPQPLPLLTRMGNKNCAVLSIMPCQCILQKSSVATCCTRQKSPLNYCHPGPGNENPPTATPAPPTLHYFHRLSIPPPLYRVKTTPSAKVKHLPALYLM